MGRNFRRVGRALFGGAVLAAVIASALYICAGIVLEPLIYSTPPSNIWTFEIAVQTIFGMALTGLVLIFPVAATAGIFWHGRQLAAGKTTAARYWLPGAIAGFFLGALLGGLASGHQPAALSALMLAWGVLLGGLTGFFFWAIRRPDRDASANPPTSAP